MKFNRRSARVWLTFLVAGVNLLIGVALAYLTPRRSHRPTRVLLLGHHFYGNLRAFYEYAEWRAHGLDCRFLYLDHRQYLKYRRVWPGVMGSFRIDHMAWAARADVIVADRGLGLFDVLTLLRPGIKKVQTWHGVAFKGHPPETLAQFQDFDLVLASSERFRQVWHCEGQGPPLERIAVTGFARTDPLVEPLEPRDRVVHALDLNPDARQRVLIAPTWKQDHEGRSIVPFGLQESEFFSEVDSWAASRRVEVAFRIHLNTGSLERKRARRSLEPQGFSNIAFRSMDDYPRTEHILLASDVLVADWSGISTDYLALDRPIVFLDVPPPFKYGFGILDGNDRAGPVVGSLGELLDCLDEALSKPMAHLDRYRDERARVKMKAFDQTLDGRSSARYLHEILALLEPKT